MRFDSAAAKLNKICIEANKAVARSAWENSVKTFLMAIKLAGFETNVDHGQFD